MLIAIIPLLVAIAGALIYAFAANPKAAEIGRILFFCGVFFVTMVVARETIRLGTTAHPTPPAFT
jgi:hypothetical protein